MSTPTLSRRALARLALASAASVLVMNNTSHAETSPSTQPTEGDTLTAAVPLAAGYTLSPAQATEVAAALKDYPKGFAKARAFVLPNSQEPAFIPTSPAPSDEKGKGK